MKSFSYHKRTALSFALLIALIIAPFSHAGPIERDREDRTEQRSETISASEAREIIAGAGVRAIGITRQTLVEEAARYKSDQANLASLIALIRNSAEDEVTRGALRSYFSVIKASDGRISVYPAELKQILETWPKSKVKIFVETLDAAASGTNAHAETQDVFEQALKNKRILNEYRANKTLLSLNVLNGLELDRDTKQKVAALASDLDISPAATRDLRSLLSSLYLKIYLGNGSNMQKSEKMANAGNKIMKAVSALDDQSQREISFAIGTCVIRLEQYQREEFVREPFNLTTDPSYPHKHFTEYPTWAKSFVTGTATYERGRDGGVLSIPEIRNIMAHNEWPVGMRPHDTRHIHYAVGHPRGVALVFESSRSKNTLRHRMLGAMYEAVDTVQYMYERELSAYFRNKGMDLEQGLEFVARANNATLKKINQEATNGNNLDANEVQNWKLPIFGKFDGLGKSGTGFEAEVDTMVRTLTKLGEDPANRYWMNYDYTMQSGAGSVETDDPSKH